MTASTVSMKLLIETSKSPRVLFAEASKDCIDLLFHVLSLPVATVIRLLQEQGMEGSLPNLYKSLENLNDTYIQPGKSKDTLLKPVAPVSSSSVPLLALEDESVGKNFYRCNCQYGRYDHVSDKQGVICPHCRREMTTNVVYVPTPALEGGGLVKEVVTYMVMDNLEVTPMSTISSITLLNKFNVKDVGALEEKIVNLGMSEAIKLLKISLESKYNVLTQLFC